uniref:Lipase 12 n=1 Tax=Lygus lineolaris TaxID=50650 RepID=A0A286K5J9_LYGLI|nr:lipase 12 [Lygus lineolaris]
MRPLVQFALSLGVVLAVSVSSLEAAASRLKECGEFGCYEEPDDGLRYGLSDLWEDADEFFVRDKDFDKKTTEELKKNTTFNLYYTNNPSVFEPALIDNKPLYKYFDKKKNTKIIVHGWKNNHLSEIGQGIKDAYIKANARANIIIVDWSNGSFRFYNRAKACVPLVANILAEFVDRLVKELGLDVKKLHIIGHSLGAHVSGLAGVRIKAGKPKRVTGLDPARPTFDNKDTEKISKNSGDFVDIVHSCANRLGLSERLGHLDFYPNRGEALQRGCLTDYDGSCSHSRSYQIFAEALTNPKGFKGTLCNNWEDFRSGKCKSGAVQYIGEEIPAKFVEGSYYLKTAKNSPLAAGEQSSVMSAQEIKEDDEDSVLAKMLFKIL